MPPRPCKREREARPYPAPALAPQPRPPPSPALLSTSAAMPELRQRPPAPPPRKRSAPTPSHRGRACPTGCCAAGIRRRAGWPDPWSPPGGIPWRQAMPGQLQRRQKKPHPAGLPMAVPFAASALLKAAELGPEELLARLSAHARTHVPDRSSHSPATSSPPTMDCSAGLISMGLARNLLQVTPTGSRAWCGSIIKSAMFMAN